jgi:hypothetical protein
VTYPLGGYDSRLVAAEWNQLAFKVAARTVLELGAELISSDAIAIYELIKNAIDARSPDGVTIEFCVTLRYSDFVDAVSRAEDIIAADPKGGRGSDRFGRELADLKESTVARILPDAPIAARRALTHTLQEAPSAKDFLRALRETYRTGNWIEFRDSGHGMSREDLLRAYLVIGTPSRRRDLDTTLFAGSREARYLGEKGVGRLSVMRLGSGLLVTTATSDELARLFDPLSRAKRRFRIVAIFNGERIDIPRFDRALLELAHAKATGRYLVENGEPKLDVDLWCGNQASN